MNSCGQCKHWHGKPKAPLALGEPQRGDCRAMPPSVTVIMQRHGVQVQQLSVASYPDLPENFPACGQFAAKVLTTGGVDR